ncbi:unnamed protein product [Camellia sinensis]
MSYFPVEDFVGNGALKGILPRLLEEGWDNVRNLKLMKSEDMDAINMTQQQKDALEMRSYLHDRALMQYGDKLEDSRKSLAKLLELSNDDLSAQFGMKRGHIASFLKKKISCYPLQAPHSLPSTQKTTTSPRYNYIINNEVSLLTENGNTKDDLRLPTENSSHDCDAKPVYLPMEICKIVEGQRYSKKLNEKQVSALLKATCQRPDVREGSIKQMVRHNNYNNDKLVNEEFGIQVRAELASLKYHDTGKETQVDPRVGVWNMIDKKMVNGGKVEFWTCISFSRSRINLDEFCRELISMCRTYPGQIEKDLHDIHARSTEKLANMGLTGKQLQLLIIVLPDVSGSYGKIKRVCETELGIVGGRNTVLMSAIERRIPFVTDRPTIIFGVDVTHSQPEDDASPSIAVVVASMDWPEVTKYRGLVFAQGHKEEIIQDLYKTYQDPQRGTVHCGMIRELLIAFKTSTGQKPHRIIFYRDGVSEGQFNQVLVHEMDAIRKACVSLEEHYLPRVTFVVVQKRHHTRLFPADHNDRRSTDRSGNILPGTVVDTHICHPNEFDFYLCSHAGIQGTSRFIAMYAILASRDVDCCLIPESPFFLEVVVDVIDIGEHVLKLVNFLVWAIATPPTVSPIWLSEQRRKKLQAKEAELRRREQDVYMYFRGSGKAAEMKREAAKWTMMAALP